MDKCKRVFEILKFIAKNKKFCTYDLSKELEVNIRTVQRDIEDIKEYFDIEFQPISKGCYKIKELKKVEDILSVGMQNSKDFEKLIDILYISNPSLLKIFGWSKDDIKKLINEDENIYLIKEPIFEDLKNFTILEKLKKAIKFRQYIDIVYEAYKKEKIIDAKPIKIVFIDGNWFLATVTEDIINNGFKFLRINFIKDIEIKTKTFQRDYNALDFLKRFQTPFSSYKKPYFDVIVEVDKEVARYFKVKKHLPSQQILKDKGDLTIKYQINNELEILMLAKKWLPHMKIVSPIYLQEKLISLVKDFLKNQ